MPRGTYRWGSGAVEEFSCAPGPAGWRWVSTGPYGRLDLTLDGTGRQLRVELADGGWVLRGGVSAAATTWVRGGAEHSATAAGFTGSSPGLLLAVARGLRLDPGTGTRVRLVAVTAPALATRVVDESWELLATSVYGPLQVSRYRVTPLDTGEPYELHVTPDVLLTGPDVELATLS